MVLLNIVPESNSKLEFNVDISFFEFSNNGSYSSTKNGSEINGYSFAKTIFCPIDFPTK